MDINNASQNNMLIWNAHLKRRARIAMITEFNVPGVSATVSRNLTPRSSISTVCFSIVVVLFSFSVHQTYGITILKLCLLFHAIHACNKHTKHTHKLPPCIPVNVVTLGMCATVKI